MMAVLNYFLRLHVMIVIGIHLCSSLNKSHEIPLEGSKISVNIYTTTLLEVEGISTIPPVFGITAYKDIEDLATTEGTKFLNRHNIDMVGLGQALSSVLPSSKYTLNASTLEKWFEEGRAFNLYKKSHEYIVLKNRGIRSSGAIPFLFLRIPPGSCKSYYCWNGGTPKSKTNKEEKKFLWWSTLLSGYLGLALKTDSNIDMIHIWNEPDSTFWCDGKNGTYYTKFFTSVAAAIKNKWPNVKLGGPVSSLPTTSTYINNSKKSFSMWHQYIKPLIDRGVPNKLLDFIDFHAYNNDISPEVLLNAIETTVSYAVTKFNTYLPVAITESSVINSSTSNNNFNYQSRTFQLMKSTFALIKHPDKIIGRLTFDYKGTSKCPNCQFRRNGLPTPEADMYFLLGKLVNGSRLHVQISGGEYMTSGCLCEIGKSWNQQPVVGEAVIVGTNVTVALLNMCNCELTVKMAMIGTKNSAILGSWAAYMDQSLDIKEVTPLSWSSSSQSLKLTSYSLYIVTYQFSTRFSEKTVINSTTKFNSLNYCLFGSSRGKHFPVQLHRVRQSLSAFPANTKFTMMSLPSTIPCDYTFTVLYTAGQSLNYKPIYVLLRIGFIGKAQSINWIATWRCSKYYATNVAKYSNNWLQIASPGLYFEGELPCIPRIRMNGVIKINFKANIHCTSKDNNTLSSSSKKNYLAFSSLVYVSESSLY